VDRDELSPRTLADYYDTCRLVVKLFTPNRLVADLAPDDFSIMLDRGIAITPQRTISQKIDRTETTTSSVQSDLCGKTERKSEKSIKTLPKIPLNKDVLRLAKRINMEYGKTATTKKEIAMDFTENDKQRADNLLRQLRTYKYLLE
jgi:hypothetical protein